MACFNILYLFMFTLAAITALSACYSLVLIVDNEKSNNKTHLTKRDIHMTETTMTTEQENQVKAYRAAIALQEKRYKNIRCSTTRGNSTPVN